MPHRSSQVPRLLVACLLGLLGATLREVTAQQGPSAAPKRSRVAANGGWTEFAAQPSARVIHVAADGDDAGPGTKSRPKATLQAAYETLRDGSTDCVLLRRGDRWTLSKTFLWSKSGPEADDDGWMRVGAYGDEREPRPVLEFVGGAALHLTPGYRSDRVVAQLAFADLHLVAADRRRDPRAASGYAVMLVAVEWRGESGTPFQGILFENLKLQGFGGGISSGKDVRDLRVRRSIFVDLYNPGGQGTHCSALLSEADGLLIEENVFFRIQHPDLEGVDAISHFSHSAYIGAAARDVVCRGNFVIKATEGLMVRSGGIYERNVSAENAIACMFGQAYGVTPTADGVPVEVRENLFLDNQEGFHLGNARGGTFAQNLLLRSQRDTPAQDLILIGRNAQGTGENIGVHRVRVTENHLSGAIRFAQPEKDERHYSGLDFVRNRDEVEPPSKDLRDFLQAARLSGSTLSDYGELLVARDRSNFDARLQTKAILDHYRRGVGLPALKP